METREFTWDPAPSKELEDYAKRFEKRVEKVTDGIYSAIGYALGNIILVVTDHGNVIIDTTESMDAALEVKKEFDLISNQPTLAVIYTHGHPDHIMGTSAFADENTEVYAHKKTLDFYKTQLLRIWPILSIRSSRQFGAYLPKGNVACSGLGPFLRSEQQKHKPFFVPPTKVFDDNLEITIGGQKFILVHAPGETDDQIFIWMPDRKVLFCGDNYYPSFPNLYAIRGTSPRPVHGWITSLDKMRDLGAEYLVPSHTELIRGSERIDELLTLYRDAIQYVHDSVLRGINKGKTPDQLAEEIKLPAHITKHIETLEVYGRVSWSVRSIFNSYLGWFDGNATGLEPLPSAERAKRIIKLAGGHQNLLNEAKGALDSDEDQWAAEISDMLLAVNPDDSAAREIKAHALFKLGDRTYNSNGRSYYYSQAYEMLGKINPQTPKGDARLAHAVPLESFFEIMPIYIDPVASAAVVLSVGFRITDTGEKYMFKVRRGVAESRAGFPENPSLVIDVNSNVWKEIALGVSDPRQAFADGQIKTNGELQKLAEFISLFKR